MFSVALAASGALRPPLPPGTPLTALLVDRALLRLLSGQRAHGAVLRELLHVPLPGPHASAAGDAAGRPGDPLGHGAGGAVCNTGADTTDRAPRRRDPHDQPNSPKAGVKKASWHSGAVRQLRMEVDIKGTHL